MGVRVGKGVFISFGSYIDTCYPRSIVIGDQSYITRGAKLIAHDHSVYRFASSLDRRSSNDDGKGFIILGKNVFVGAGAIILRNVKIGDNAVVAAGAIAVRDVSANVVVAGNPAQIIREFTL